MLKFGRGKKFTLFSSKKAHNKQAMATTECDERTQDYLKRMAKAMDRNLTGEADEIYAQAAHDQSLEEKPCVMGQLYCLRHGIEPKSKEGTVVAALSPSQNSHAHHYEELQRLFGIAATEIKHLKQRLQHERQAADDILKQKNDGLLRDLDDARHRQKDLSLVAEAREKECDSLTQKLNEATADYLKLQGELNKQNEAIVILEKTVREQTGELQKIHLLDLSLFQANEYAKSAQAENAKLAAELVETKADVKRLQNANLELETTMFRLQQQLNERPPLRKDHLYEAIQEDGSGTKNSEMAPVQPGIITISSEGQNVLKHVELEDHRLPANETDLLRKDTAYAPTKQISIDEIAIKPTEKPPPPPEPMLLKPFIAAVPIAKPAVDEMPPPPPAEIVAAAPSNAPSAPQLEPEANTKVKKNLGLGRGSSVYKTTKSFLGFKKSSSKDKEESSKKGSAKK